MKCEIFNCESLFTLVFLISSYGAPLAIRASYLAYPVVLSLGQMAQLIIMIILSLTALTLELLTGSKCIPNGTRTNHS